MMKICDLCGRARRRKDFEDRRPGLVHDRCWRHRKQRGNKERVVRRVYDLRRRAAAYGAPVNCLTPAEALLKYRRAKNRCPSCRRKLNSKYDLELSHMVALCERGDNSDANVILECSECNRHREIERRKSRAAA